jgi:hypothetical protein
MVGSIVGIALAVSSMGWWHDNTRLGRPIATSAPYPAGMADDVHRPGFNGRLWVSRPIIGGMQGPYATEESLLAERYGGYGDEDSSVYARVGSLVVGINAFESIPQNGLRRFEQARNFWLQEQGYTGGVRTFVNDAYVWRKPDGEPRVESKAKPEPLATIRVPEDMPRRKNRLRVDAGGSAAIAELGEGDARISWPANAPADAVARTAATGHIIQLGNPQTTAIVAATK